METILIISRTLFLIWLLLFPQMLGLALYFRLRRLPSWVSRTLAALAPAVVYFFIAIPFWFAGMKEAELRGEYVCGLAVMAGVTIVFMGSVLELFIGVIVQTVLSRRSRVSEVKS